MNKKIPIVSYFDEEKAVIGEAVIDDNQKVTITLTDESYVNQFMDSEADAMTIVAFEAAL